MVYYKRRYKRRYYKRRVKKSYKKRYTKKRQFKRRNYRKKSIYSKVRFQQGGRCSFSYCKHILNKRKPKILKSELLSRNTYYYSGAARISAGVGTQNPSCPVWVLDAADLTTMSSVITSNNQTQRFFVDNVRFNANFTNQDITPCRLTIYDCIARRDMVQALSNVVGTPAYAWLTGFTDMSVATPSTTFAYPGMTPFMSNDFTQYWKVVNVSEVYLLPGNVHNHHYSQIVNKIMNDAVVNYETLNIRNLTYVPMFVVEGSPANNLTSASTTISMSQANLDCVYDYKVSFQALQSSVQNVSFGRTGAVSGLPTSFQTLSVVNSLTGAIFTGTDTGA